MHQISFKFRYKTIPENYERIINTFNLLLNIINFLKTNGKKM